MDAGQFSVRFRPSDMDDWQLIDEYARRGSEVAFRTLVERHLRLVHAAALRQVNDPHLAEEVSQAVFILLARKARSLRHGVVLAGWLFRTTRFVAARALRSEQRRQRREQEALAMQSLATSDETWKRISPVLDEALAQLPDADRNAVLLRFCEGHNHQQVGAALGLTEEAARKRATRGLERLRGFFLKRGITLSAAGLASLLAVNAAPAAPAGLSASVASAALITSAVSAATLPAIVRETLAAWRWAKVKLAGTLAGGIVLVAGLGVVLAPFLPSALGFDAASAATQPPPDGLAALPTTTPATQDARGPSRREPMLRLHVLSKDTGEAVAFAQLVVNTVAADGWKQRVDLYTDVSGAADVPYPISAGRLDVGVLSWGWTARFATWRPNPDDPIPAEYTLRLDRITNTVGGWLRDAQDRPVANAEILVSFQSTGDAAHRETPRERPGIMGEAVIAKSDFNGRWTCASIPPTDSGGFTLQARHPEYRRTSIAFGGGERAFVDAPTEKLQLLWAGKLITRMDVGPTLLGRVLDGAGQPIVGARAVHSPESDNALSATTDAGGCFSFSNLAEDVFDFTVVAAGFAPEYRKVTLTNKTEAVEVRLRPGALLRLRLVDEQNVPVAGATVGLEQWGELRHKLSWRAQSDPEGHVVWDSAPPQTKLELFAVKGGWCYTRDIRVEADGEEHIIQMRRALTITGHVTDAQTGQPVAEVKAFPGYGEGDYMWERLDTRRSASGNFTVELTENKLPWRVRVEAEGYAPFVSEPLPQDFSGPLDVALQPLDSRKAVRGVVLRPDGQPAAGAEVALLTFEHNVQLSQTRLRSQSGIRLIETTDSAGRFRFQPDSKGHTVVAASVDGFVKLRVRNPAETVTLRLQPWGRIQGVIPASARSRPVEAVVLEDPALRNYEGQVTLGFRQAKPDADGRFILDYVPPLTLCLSLSSGMGVPHHHATLVKVLPGETANVAVTGSGWSVKGRLVTPAGLVVNWQKQLMSANVSSRSSVRPPGELDAEARAFWLVDFWDSNAGRRFAVTHHSYGLKVSSDGSFVSEDTIPPGDYRLSVASSVCNLEAQVKVVSSAELGSETCDLGTVQLRRLGL